MGKFTMSFAAIMFLALDVCAQAFSPLPSTWVEANIDKDISTYLDPKSISKKGTVSTMWYLENFRVEQRKRETPFFRSEAKYVAFECNEKAARVRSIVRLSDSMGKGAKVWVSNIAWSDGTWHPIKAGSILEVLWKSACGMQVVQTAATPTQLTGKSPFTVNEIVTKCRGYLNASFPKGDYGGYTVLTIDVLPAIKPNESGLPAMAIPKTDLMYPAKITAKGTGAKWGASTAPGFINVYLWKTPFGLECLRT